MIQKAGRIDFIPIYSIYDNQKAGEIDFMPIYSVYDSQKAGWEILAVIFVEIIVKK